MKKLFIALLTAAVFASCGKENSVKPIVTNTDLTNNTNTVKPGTGNNQANIYNIGIELPPQIVTTKLEQNKLTMVYNEKVNLLVDPVEYDRSWSLWLTESFTNTGLANFDYTTVTQEGNVTLNWVDGNLNNIILKSKADTVVNGVSKVKIKVARPFTFVKTYTTEQEAVDAQNAIVARQNDYISFTSFYYSDNTTLQPATSTMRVTYTKD